MIQKVLALAVAAVVVSWNATSGQTQGAGVKPATAQPPTQPPAQPAAEPAAEAADPPAFKPEELEQILSPIALYPDSMLSQVLMASTYPLEVVEADRWVKSHKDLKGEGLTKALEAEDWDASVKSLVNFPDVLAMLSERLDWTRKLGDAFIADQKAVLDAVQKLRARSKEAGKLESTKEQTVTVEQQGGTEVIVIESSDPEVVYVPSGDTTVVYGSWPYPSYPPYPYYPPGYVAHPIVSFGVGVAVGAAWGYAWGNCNWGGGDVDIDIDRNTNINNNIDRSKYKNQAQNRTGARDGKGGFQHDGAHRKGVGYRDQTSARKHGGASTSQTARARDSYRGRTQAGQQDIARRGPDQVRSSGAGANRPSASQRPSTSQRPASTRSSSSSRSSGSGMRSSSGSSTRAASSRGSSSRSGGGSRGGGGGGGRGGGGGGRR